MPIEGFVTASKEELLLSYLETRDPDTRERVVQCYLPLVEYVARKLSFSRDELDDLVQIGCMGLLRAMDRFDVTKEVDFSSFATPNIIGEIKHYFRDKRSIVKVPRRLQELYTKIKKYTREAQVSGKAPTVQELATIFEVSEDLVIEALDAWQSSSAVSLDMPAYSGSDGSQTTLLDQLGSDDHGDSVINKVTLRQAMRVLPKRERRIVFLRFYRGLSQAEIAEKLTLSQMHISRLLNASLKKLRENIEKPEKKG
jgi:RNA polymerase sigma-B factor